MKTMKTITTLVLAVTLVLAFVSPGVVDAKRGGFKSGTRSYTTTPKKSTSTDNNVQKSTTTNNKSSNTSNGMNTNRGFFGGGGFMKGLMLGGLAGLLFGGIFGSMGAFGQLLGLAVNLFAIYLIFVLVLAIVRKFKRPSYPNDNQRGGRY